MSADDLQEACRALGIADSFVDNWGRKRRASFAAVKTVVDSLQICSDHLTESDTTSVAVVRSGEKITFSWVLDASRSAELLNDLEQDRHSTGCRVGWIVETESGRQLSGTANMESSQEQGQREQIATCSIALPEVLETGYHHLQIVTSDARAKGGAFDSDSAICTISLIVVPDKAWNPYEAEETPTPGVSLQLYALRSNSNWGVGDFGDLEIFCTQAAAKGVHAVGLNPLHTLFTAHPERRSPYSPSSREFLNPIYIDVMRVACAQCCIGFANLMNSTQFSKQLADVRQATTIDYALVTSLKLQALFEVFLFAYAGNLATENAQLTVGDSEREAVRLFDDFWQNASSVLIRHAEFQAFDEYFTTERQCSSWQEWPAAYQDPTSESCTRLARQLAERVRFYVFLQWVAERQLEQVAGHCSALGMKHGLYLDLAVGVDFRAGDVWANQGLYAGGVHVGAPPDELGPLGQDWQLTPYNPRALRHSAYASVVDMLRANMRFAGILRLDHVMGMLRQYWCVPDQSEKPEVQVAEESVNGCYVDFPFDDLMGVIALESHRNQCVIVGEDLGTVPKGFRQNLKALGILGYRVLYFERTENGEFLPPAEYSKQTLATASTHDLPTLAGYFLSRDISVRDELGHYSDIQAAEAERLERTATINQLLDCVKNFFATQLLNEQDIKEIDDLVEQLSAEHPSPDSIKSFVELIHRLIASAGSQIIMFQLDDLMLQPNMVNLPGTVNAYPNWQNRLPVSLDEVPVSLSFFDKIFCSSTTK